MNFEENFNSQKAMIEWLMKEGNLHFQQAMVIIGFMENGCTLCCAWHNLMFPEMKEDENEMQCKAALQDNYNSRCFK